MPSNTTWLNGGVLINKPAGLTSHDVVAMVRRPVAVDTKVGHSGTLDPFATGLLIILLGAGPPLWRAQFWRQFRALRTAGKVELGLLQPRSAREICAIEFCQVEVRSAQLHAGKVGAAQPRAGVCE